MHLKVGGRGVKKPSNSEIDKDNVILTYVLHILVYLEVLFVKEIVYQ